MAQFKLGDKVIPISKSILGPLSVSSVWGAAIKKHQLYIYIVNIDDEKICCALKPIMATGDYFLPNDLVLYDEFTIGEVVEVKTSEKSRWCKRTFVTIHIVDGEVIYYCVSSDYDKETPSPLANGYKFEVYPWKFCRKIPEFIPIQVKLNDKHTAVVYQDHVKVDCQTFTFDSITELYNNIQKVKKETNGNKI